MSIRKVILLFCASLALSFTGLANPGGGRRILSDSTVTDLGDGERLVQYGSIGTVFDLLPASEPQSHILSQEEKERHLLEMLKEQETVQRQLPAKIKGALRSPSANYSVGGIPLEEGVSPSGARTYTFPLSVASEAKLSPTLVLSYNSQAGFGLAGYGWELSGISTISLINRNVYYHGKAEAARSTAPDAVFALDGIPLVQNDDAATMGEYPLATASGHIIAKKEANAAGFVTRFIVRYPNGIKAQYSLGYDVATNYPSYPIIEMEDLDGNRVEYTYSKESQNGNYQIAYIRYNFDASGQAGSEVEFRYESSSDRSDRYFAGKAILLTSRLSRIISRNHGYTLADYSLRYLSRDNVHLLEQVGCKNDVDSLPPLSFSYGDLNYWYGAATATLEQRNSFQYLSSYFPSGTDCVYRRGKFVKNRFNDGLIIYPNHPNYSIRETHYSLFQGRTYLYGSPVSADQVILFVPYLNDTSGNGANQVNASLTAEEGFQTLEAVDIEGDGVDELVKVNFDGTDGGKTVLRITIYKCNDSGVPTCFTSFTAKINGTITSGDYVSPLRRNYYWGDFKGNGTSQLLAIAYDENGFNVGQTCYASLIDLKTYSVLSDQFLFTYGLEDNRNVLAMDIDGDGRTELCHATASGFDIYRLQTGNTFAVDQSFTSVNSSILSSDQTYFTDLNADGYLDILYALGGNASSLWTRYIYTGENIESRIVTIEQHNTGDRFMFMDLNQDQYPDMVKINTAGMGVRINRDGAFFDDYRASTTAVSDTSGVVPCNVMDYRGMSAFVKVEGYSIRLFGYGCSSPKIRYLTSSVDSYGKTLSSSYVYLPEQSVYWTDDTYSPNSIGYAKRTLPIYVLWGEDGLLPASGIRHKSRNYNYYDGVVSNQELGFCGFAHIRSYDQINTRPIRTDSYFDPTKRGILSQVEARDGYADSSPLFASQSNTYDNHYTTYGKQNPRLTQSVSNDLLTGITTNTSYTYDSYDFPLAITVQRRIGAETAKEEKTVQTYLHSTNPDKYVLGITATQSVSKEGDGSTTVCWQERDEFTYDSSFHPLTHKQYVGRYGSSHPTDPIIIPADSLIRPPFLSPNRFPIQVDYTADNLVSETRWQYDTHGNVISEKTAPYGATEFTGNTNTYDTDGRYLLTTTNALGQTTTYGNYNRFGKPVTVTDFQNRTKTFTYDGWGNIVSTTYADGTVESTQFAWDGIGVYTVARSATGQPERIVHYDALGRDIRTGIKRFNAQWQFTDRQYDRYGNLHRESLPFRGSEASYWNEYTYDHFNRPVSLTEASGNVSTWSYFGTSTTTVRDGVSSTSTTDADGHVVSVTDAGGTITYTLRDDGQPSQVTAPGSVTTTFTYDDYGRRTKIIDPSAGTQTETYVWNADGSSQVTHTNPNGTVITSKDKYGRTTSIQRTGEYSTSYTYDGYGRLGSIQSTNGTGTVYTYDTFDRILTEKETVPDGKWLRKTITYGPGSSVSSVQYTSQDGDITTETFAYANGHQTGITLPDGTVVWSLVSENSQGLINEIVTGSINREYGYTAYGFPTYRGMDHGVLQDFTYEFNQQTGNLTSRQDCVNNRIETFGYDALNRLMSIGNRQITYADNGNIVSMGGVGTMEYGSNTRPYQITGLYPEEERLVPDRAQFISYTCYNRPSVLTEGSRTAAFTYDADGNRVRMQVTDSTQQVLTRYYAGGCYEYDETPTGSRERLYLGGDAYSAPMVFQRENSGTWTAYNIGRDYLGSITHIATADGTLVAEYSYDPWGRLRNPQTLEIYAPGQEPDLFLGRGFTGHEHLTWFGLINMNARLYDPLLGRFLSPDPYVQAPDFSQNFNRYSYALNNPLRYIDESGECWNIIGGAILGGIAGLVSNWNNCNGFWEYFTAFGVGAAAGAMVGATGGAAAAAEGGFWATAGVVGTGVVSGAATGATSEIISQTGKNFEGIEFVDWKSVGTSAIASGIAGGVGSGIGVAMSSAGIPITINGTVVESPIVSSFVSGYFASGAGHIAGGTATGLLWGESLQSAFENSLNGLGTSMLMGGVFSATATASYDLANRINPINGNPLSDCIYQLANAKDLGLLSEVNRIKEGIIYEQYKHDGTVFNNYEGYLPSGVTYTEYVVPPANGYSPGPCRIVVGSNNSWYYTPDHYHTFFQFKP